MSIDVLTAGRLVALAQGAGFSTSQARIMAAVALAESGGNPAAVGDQSLADSTWGPSIGYWQIRSLRAHTGTGKERDATRLTDPAFNARSARIIFGQQGYRAWTVYRTGAYGRHLPLVDQALGTKLEGDGGAIGGVPDPFDLPGVDNLGDVAGKAGAGVLGGLDAIGSFFGALGQRGTWVRVLQVVGGTGLVVGGLAFLGTDIARPVLNAAADVLPAGKAVKAAGAVTKAASSTKAAAAAV